MSSSIASLIGSAVTPPPASSINVTAVVGGKSFAISQFSVSNGVYGSVGHASITTSRKLLTGLGINIIALTTQAPASAEVDIYVTVGGVMTRIFGGEYVSGEWNYDSDAVMIHARNWAGLLADQKRVITNLASGGGGVLTPGQAKGSTGILVEQQSVGSIVQAIGKEFGFTVDTSGLQAQDLPSAPGAAAPNPIGSLYGSDDVTFMTAPQSLWAVLNRLALDTGYDVYVTPMKTLVFGQANIQNGKQLPPILLNYNTATVAKGAYPCRGLKIMHNPRRNGTFRVVVLAYDAGAGQIVTGRATVVGTNIQGTGNQQLQPGIWSGNDAVGIDAVFTANNIEVPLYTFHHEGMTTVQAQQKATSIAMDISKREMILECSIDGLASINPAQKVMLQGGVDSVFSGNTYYVGSFTHTFRMPTSHHDSDAGFVTHIKALNLPEPGIGSAVKAKTSTK